jgi:hypothetical protein
MSQVGPADSKMTLDVLRATRAACQARARSPLWRPDERAKTLLRGPDLESDWETSAGRDADKGSRPGADTRTNKHERAR